MTTIKYYGSTADRIKLDSARKVYEDAKSDLGDDLSGHSLVDLLADNFPWPLVECQNVARILTDTASACSADVTPCARRQTSEDNVCEHYPEPTHREGCPQHGATPEDIQEHGVPCLCDEPESTHTAICEEYWERGLECRCIPEGVKDAIRNGARPEEVM